MGFSSVNTLSTYKTLEDLYYLYYFISEEAEDQNYEAEKRGTRQFVMW